MLFDVAVLIYAVGAFCLVRSIEKHPCVFDHKVQGRLFIRLLKNYDILYTIIYYYDIYIIPIYFEKVVITKVSIGTHYEKSLINREIYILCIVYVKEYIRVQ